MQRIACQTPGAPADQTDNREADQRIDPPGVGKTDYQRGKNHARRHRGIAGHMEKCAAQIDIVVPPAHEHQCGDSVDRDADGSNDHHHSGIDRMGIEQATDRFERDRAQGDQQQRGIGQRG